MTPVPDDPLESAWNIPPADYPTGLERAIERLSAEAFDRDLEQLRQTLAAHPGVTRNTGRLARVERELLRMQLQPKHRHWADWVVSA